MTVARRMVAEQFLGWPVEQLRPNGSREPPPLRAVLGAARHSKVGLFFAKPPLALARKGEAGGTEAVVCRRKRIRSLFSGRRQRPLQNKLQLSRVARSGGDSRALWARLLLNCGFSVDASGESQVSVANVAAFRLGVASAVMGRSRPNECPSFGLSSSRLCESPPLRAVLGAARHSKVGLFFAKPPLASAREIRCADNQT